MLIGRAGNRLCEDWVAHGSARHETVAHKQLELSSLEHVATILLPPQCCQLLKPAGWRMRPYIKEPAQSAVP